MLARRSVEIRDSSSWASKSRRAASSAARRDVCGPASPLIDLNPSANSVESSCPTFGDSRKLTAHSGAEHARRQSAHQLPRCLMIDGRPVERRHRQPRKLPRHRARAAADIVRHCLQQSARLRARCAGGPLLLFAKQGVANQPCHRGLAAIRWPANSCQLGRNALQTSTGPTCCAMNRNCRNSHDSLHPCVSPRREAGRAGLGSKDAAKIAIWPQANNAKLAAASTRVASRARIAATRLDAYMARSAAANISSGVR